MKLKSSTCLLILVLIVAVTSFWWPIAAAFFGALLGCTCFICSAIEDIARVGHERQRHAAVARKVANLRKEVTRLRHVVRVKEHIIAMRAAKADEANTVNKPSHE